MKNNVTGLVQMEEPNVRSGGDVAMGAAGSAAKGAQMGATFGPYGAAAGAVLGGAIGLAGGLSGKAEEERRLKKAKIYNKGVRSHDGRAMNSQSTYTMQARYGMHVDEDGVGKYKAKVESEKGEKVYDKNWNLLHNFDKKEAPTHEEVEATGDKSTTKTLPEGATVVPKKDLPKVQALIKRYKLKGDGKAATALDNIRGDYKTTAEANGKARDGIFNIPGDKDFDYQYKEGKWYTKPFGSENEWSDMSTSDDYRDGIPVLENRFGFKQQSDAQPSSSGVVEPTISNEQSLNPNARQGSLYEADYTFTPSADTTVDTPEAEATTEEAARTGQGINKALGALNYISAANNMYQGLQPSDRVERRFVSNEDVKYVDRSNSQRRAVAEGRNATLRGTRGKGLSAAQQQSYAGQAGARYTKGIQAINEGENRKADNINQFNTNQRNRTRQTNLQLANQYDMQDAQAEAVKQRYFDTAMSETATLSQLAEQKRGMQSRNNKQYAMDDKRLNFMNQMFPNFGVDEDGVNYRDGYK